MSLTCPRGINYYREWKYPNQDPESCLNQLRGEITVLFPNIDKRDIDFCILWYGDRIAQAKKQLLIRSDKVNPCHSHKWFPNLRGTNDCMH